MASDKHRSKKEKEKVESLSHMRLCDPMDPSPPGSAVPGFSRQERWVYSRITAGMTIRNSSLFIEIRNLSRYEGELRNVN